jgi:hypothetical protein
VERSIGPEQIAPLSNHFNFSLACAARDEGMELIRLIDPLRVFAPLAECEWKELGEGEGEQKVI